MIGEEGALTENEKALIVEYKNTEFMRIARKAIGQQWRYTASRLTRATPESLQFHQGVMAGLENAYNMLMSISPTEEPEKRGTVSKIL